MILEKTNSMRLKYNLQAIPVCLVALVLWALFGGWYVTIAPINMAGTDNIGIVLSILGLCLFLADRFAFFWFKVQAQVIVFTTWIWGVAFIIWGLLEWLHSFSRQYLSLFIIHWSIFLVIIVVTVLMVSRRRHDTE